MQPSKSSSVSSIAEKLMSGMSGLNLEKFIEIKRSPE
jgi:hypothetical protein